MKRGPHDLTNQRSINDRLSIDWRNYRTTDDQTFFSPLTSYLRTTEQTMHIPTPVSPLLTAALQVLLVEKRGSHPQVSLVEGVEYMSVLWATTRFDGVPGFDRQEGWYFDSDDDDRGVVAVHLDAGGAFHVTNPDADFAYLSGKLRTAQELETVLMTLDSIKSSTIKGILIKDQPLAGLLE
jgi:hypothetical protein